MARGNFKCIKNKLKPAMSPSARAGMSMVTVDNKIFMFGGSGP